VSIWQALHLIGASYRLECILQDNISAADLNLCQRTIICVLLQHFSNTSDSCYLRTAAWKHPGETASGILLLVFCTVKPRHVCIHNTRPPSATSHHPATSSILDPLHLLRPPASLTHSFLTPMTLPDVPAVRYMATLTSIWSSPGWIVTTVLPETGVATA